MIIFFFQHLLHDYLQDTHGEVGPTNLLSAGDTAAEHPQEANPGSGDQLRQEHDYIDFDATATLSHPSIDTGTMTATESIVEQGVNVGEPIEETAANFTLPLSLEQYTTSRLQGLLKLLTVDKNVHLYFMFDFHMELGCIKFHPLRFFIIIQVQSFVTKATEALNTMQYDQEGCETLQKLLERIQLQENSSSFSSMMPTTLERRHRPQPAGKQNSYSSSLVNEGQHMSSNM